MIGIKPVFDSPFGTLFKPVWGYAALSKPCLTNMVAYWKDTWTSDGTKLIDKYATGTHDAIKGQSLKFSGAQNVSYDLTGYEHLGAECHDISFSFYNSVAINAASSVGYILQLGTGQNYNGIAFGASTGILTDEIIAVLSNSDGLGRSGYTSPTAEIAVGKHSVSVTWNGTGYDIYLDGSQVNNAASEDAQALLLLDRIFIGSRVDPPAYLDSVNLYDIVIKNASGTVIFSDYLAAGSGSETIPVVGPIGTLNGFTLPDDWTESVLYGHSWNNGSYLVADGTGSYSSGAYLPASYAGTESGTLRTGTARHNLSVFGYTGDWDGVTYGVTDRLSPGGGEHTIEALVDNITSISGSGEALVSSGSSTGDVLLQINIAGRAKAHCWIDGALKSATGTSDLRDGDRHVVKQVVTSTDIEIWVDGVRENSTAHLGVFSTPVRNLAISSLTTSSGFGQLTSGNRLISAKIYVPTGTLTNHWTVESTKDSLQPTIYDVVGGNHATLTGATLGVGGFWSVKSSPSYLAQYGGQVSGNDVIPYGANTAALTFNNVWDAPGDLLILNQAESKEMADSDTLNEFFTALGVVEDIAPEDVTVTDTERIGTKGFATLSAAQTGDCLAKTNSFTGI